MSDDEAVSVPRWTAESLRLRMERLGMGPQELAGALLDAAKPDLARKVPSRSSVLRSVHMHLSGRTSPRSLYAELYRRVFSARGMLDLPPESGPDGDHDWERVRELLRRTFLKNTTGAVLFPALPGPERLTLQALEVMGSGHAGSLVDGLRELVEHYALTINASPPAQIYDELLTIKAYANSVPQNKITSHLHRDFTTASGWLSALLSIAACDMGEHAAARIWCSDTEKNSCQSGHPELTAWAALTRSVVAFYQGHPQQSVTLAARGRELAPGRTVVRAKLAAQEMRAAAMVGDEERVLQTHDSAARLIAQLPQEAATASGAFSIKLSDDPPYTATSLMLLGRHREAVDATHRVIGTVYRPEARQRGEHPSSYARSLLILGLAHAGAGNLDGAVEAGHAALSSDRPAWPTLVLAGKLDHTLRNTFGNAPHAEDYRARYRELTAKTA
ncbi:hypothetical protein DPM19_28360 [Actinomadura craniellae]|uniref:XRE family transcriptional regulator n=1 Tax=Actinomadura craniellae TaxID=2231787 RepID=A0A365H113_9ACTN|nr:hypothetical protein [Actinomadura craniellae]RAY11883.1 hypothetical protein DPM19_28360 [Actinomadura craniellae]